MMTEVEELQYKMEALLHTKTGAEARKLTEALIAAVRKEEAAGTMSCPFYTHGWANDDDYQGEVHCCNRKKHEMSWNPMEIEAELKKTASKPKKKRKKAKEAYWDPDNVGL